jgi:hypothetical protein
VLIIFSFFILPSSWAIGAGESIFAMVEGCKQPEKDGKLLHQLLSKNKKCINSSVLKGSTDCIFQAEGTSIRIVGATEGSVETRAIGYRGTGYYIESVDSEHTVRTLQSKSHGVVIRLDRKDNLKKCLYDDAYILLDSRVLVRLSGD